MLMNKLKRYFNCIFLYWCAAFFSPKKELKQSPPGPSCVHIASSTASLSHSITFIKSNHPFQNNIMVEFDNTLGLQEVMGAHFSPGFVEFRHRKLSQSTSTDNFRRPHRHNSANFFLVLLLLRVICFTVYFERSSSGFVTI